MSGGTKVICQLTLQTVPDYQLPKPKPLISRRVIYLEMVKMIVEAQ